MTIAPGRVFIIGAGPGDPGLMTVRGVRPTLSKALEILMTAVPTH